LSFGQCGVSSVRPEQCCHTRSFLRSRDLTYSLTWYRCNSRLRSAILYTLLRSHNAFLLSEALSKECTHQPPLQIWKQMPAIHENRAHNKAQGAHDVTFFQFYIPTILQYVWAPFYIFYNYTFFWLSSFAQPQSKCLLFVFFRAIAHCVFVQCDFCIISCDNVRITCTGGVVATRPPPEQKIPVSNPARV
jgi:hypothetical protein